MRGTHRDPIVDLDDFVFEHDSKRFVDGKQGAAVHIRGGATIRPTDVDQTRVWSGPPGLEARVLRLAHGRNRRGLLAEATVEVKIRRSATVKTGEEPLRQIFMDIP